MSFYDDASLVFLPSGQAGKDGKAYSMKPTDGSGDFTFSRGSNLTATRVDSNGLIEKGRENLLLQSNQFDTTWSSSNFTLTPNQSGYDGSSDAWKAAVSVSYAGLIQNVNGSGVYTFSGYFRKGDSNEGIRFNFDASTDTNVYVNLTDGSSTFNGGLIERSITDAGNGFYKVVVTANLTNLTGVRIFVTNGTTTQVAGNIYIQDFQLEQGLVATEYIESGASKGKAGLLENEPRFDYSGGASCPSLLLEPSRTQIVRQSEYIDGYSSKVQCTTTPNYGTSPEGLTNSTRLQFTANGYIHEGVAQVSATQYTISAYAKRNDSGTQSFGFFVDGSGTIDSAVTLTSDWQRFEYTYTATNSSFFGFAGNSGADVSVYGLQLEQASYPTSYIPNHSGGSVTRAADDLNDLSVSVNNEGTFYFETKDRIFENESSNKNYLGLIESSSGNYFRFRGQSSSILIQSIGFGSNISFNPSGANLTKYLYKWDGTTIKVFVDGVERGSVSQTARFEPDTFRKAGGGSIGFSSNLKQLLIFTTALPDNQCIALTS